MQEKIDWYQEVVDLEPSSKLFFPLAKMVAEQDVSRAVETLQRGLDRHPEFIEARFYFVELLHKHSATADYSERLATQLSILSPMLSRYAGFWQAWGKNLLAEQEGETPEKALAVSFLGAMCANEKLSLADIFAAGLQSLGAKHEAQQSASVQAVVEPAPESIPETIPELTPEPIQEPVQEQAPAMEASAPAEQIASTTGESGVSVSGKIKTSPPVTKPNIKISATKPKIVIKGIEKVQATQKTLHTPPVVTEENGEDTISLRTRSMADILAEQGDYAAALEIYQELLQGVANEDEKKDLQDKIAQLQEGGHAVEVVEGQGPAEGKISSPGNERMISVLGALADRLDARAHS